MFYPKEAGYIKYRYISILLLVIFVLAGCASKNPEPLSGGAGEPLIIPDKFKNSIMVNCFENTWSRFEDGSDLSGSFILTDKDEDFKVINKYLTNASVSPAINSGNFTPDFSFISSGGEGSGYDFVFLGHDLILRRPDGGCFKIEISEDYFHNLMAFIEEIRINESESSAAPELITGGYGEDRELDGEDKSIFDEATKDLTGVKYEPKLVATQIVAGTNYRFTVTTAETPDGEPHQTFIYIFKPLGGGAPELVGII